MRKLLLFFTLFITAFTIESFAQTGKINGYVRDAETGEELIGANVILEGTTMGAATNIEGYYVITNVPPGSYTIRASMVGYAPQTIRDVRVNINLTTELNINLKTSTIQTEEVVVVATQPIVRQDVSSSVVNLNIEEVKSLPVVSVSGIIGLQAGVQGLTIRGGGSDQTAFVVNGITLRDERDNTPYTGISFTSIEELQIQTGGFNAEYGNIRSGLINIVTKEGKKDKYTVSFIGRYRPAGRKHFGAAVNDPNSYWIKPYIDNDVAWTGTNNGKWDIYTQRNYAKFPGGWNAVSEALLSDSDPTNDLTPEAAQQVFLWQHRRELDIKRPDYDVDMSVSGPVPGGQTLGNLRFLASYRQTREMYYIPLSKDSYQDFNAQIRLTSDIATGMKLSVEGLYGEQTGTNSSRAGGPGLFRSASGIASNIDWRSGASFTDARVYASDYWAPSKIITNMQGFKFTHVLSPQTFYEVLGSRVASKYDTNPGRKRDTRKLYNIGGVLFDESPIGYFSGVSSGIGSAMNMGLGYSNSRDSSKLATYTLKTDFASQIDKYNYVKTGFEFIYTDNNVNYGLIEPALPSSNSISAWHTFPKRLGVYVQDKLEFEGMIANLGIRLDYLDPGGDWYEYDPYNKALSGKFAGGLDTLLKKVSVEKQLNISPRLGVAFPITVNSKLYFNYGHFRSMPVPENLFLLRRSLSTFEVTRIANPSNPLPRTIAYELGYEQNMFDQFLLSIKGYYKDISDQPRLVTYISRNGAVNYSRPEPNNYADIRGFEIELRKNRGEWITGFFNYTYMVTSSGFFGLDIYYEDPALFRQRQTDTKLLYQNKPVPQPYARANIDIFTPDDWGPTLGGFKIFEKWRLNLLGTWSSGTYFSWTGPGAAQAGYENNFQWNDFYNLDLRLSKTINIGRLEVEFFMDMYNALNIRYMGYQAGFVDAQDYYDYMKSLHLPADKVKDFNYGNIPGDDNPGDFRKPGVEWQPLEYANNVFTLSNPNTRAWYFDAQTSNYYQWDGNKWNKIPDSKVKDVLDNKAYIDMPNLHYTTFLNPRNIFFGIKFNFDL